MLTGVEMHEKGVSIEGAHFKSHWVKRSADTDRESLGDFDPAFVSDLLVEGHVQAGQVRVDLQDIDRKRMVSGGANSAQNASKVFVGGGSSVWVPIFRIQRQRRN